MYIMNGRNRYEYGHGLAFLVAPESQEVECAGSGVSMANGEMVRD